MIVKNNMYIVGMTYLGTIDTFEPSVICGTREEAKQWIDKTMEGYVYNGTGYYVIKEISFVSIN